MKNTFSCSKKYTLLFYVLGLPLHPLFHVQERERERKCMTINIYFDLIKLEYFIGMFMHKL
jgi:hypothetical protein